MGDEMTLKEMGRGIESDNLRVRCTAFQACVARSHVPLWWLERSLNDWFWDIRTTVSKILFNMGYQFPLVRTFEPADKVYKRCQVIKSGSYCD